MDYKINSATKSCEMHGNKLKDTIF